MLQLAETSNPTSSTSLPLSWAERIIQKMLVLYGKKFTEQWGSMPPDDLKRCWAEEMAGYSGAEIAHGLEACKTRTFPPTLPEFMQLCRPPIDPESAFTEAICGLHERKAGRPGIWSHPAVFWAAQKVGPYDMLNTGYQAIKARWTRALSDAMAMDCKPVPEPSAALPAPGNAELSREEARKRLAELKCGDVGSPAKANTVWASKLIERAKTDSTVSAAAVKIAREALAA